MSRPGKKVTRKTIVMNSRIKEMELKERSSRSLLANVLDMDDDFRSASGISYAPTYNSNLTNRYSNSAGAGGGGGNNSAIIVGGGPGGSSTLPHFPSSSNTSASAYHQQQHTAGIHHPQSSMHHDSVTSNMIGTNLPSSTIYGSRAGGFNIDEDSPTTPYCIQVFRKCYIFYLPPSTI